MRSNVGIVLVCWKPGSPAVDSMAQDLELGKIRLASVLMGQHTSGEGAGRFLLE
jgi:hypothetical protein